MKNWLFLLVAILVVSGCCKKKLYCQSGIMKVAFVGYTRSETRSISIKRYELNKHDKAIDSGAFIYDGNRPTVNGKPDTLWLSEYQTGSYIFNGIKPGNDWQIYMPTIRATYMLRGLEDNGHRSILVKCRDEETTCTADLAHYYVNNIWMEGTTLYIKKNGTK
jgi:hypothetical protein